MAKKQKTKPVLPRLMAVAAQKLTPLEIIQEKITLVTQSIQYLADRPRGAGFTPAEGPQIQAQFLRFSPRLGDLNDQFGAVLSDESSVAPSTEAEIKAMLDAASNLAQLNRDQAIASAVANFLDAALDAAKPLAKA